MLLDLLSSYKPDSFLTGISLLLFSSLLFSIDWQALAKSRKGTSSRVSLVKASTFSIRGKDAMLCKVSLLGLWGADPLLLLW